MSGARPYPSDLSDAEWALLAPVLPPRAPCGRPRKRPERLIADAVFYVLRSGCACACAARVPAVADGVRALPQMAPEWHPAPGA